MSYNFGQARSKIKDIEEWLGRELASVRTGRATPALLDGVSVESYGARVPLRQIGSISIEDARTLRLTLWDASQVKAADMAIAAANLGVSVTADGETLRIRFPSLTAEKRIILSKVAREQVEAARISLRQERDRIWQDIQTEAKAGKLSEDEKFRYKNELQKIIDEANKKLTATGERKEAEIMN